MTFKTLTLPLAAAICLVSGTAFAQSTPVTERMFRETHLGKCINYRGASQGQQCYRADGTTNYVDATYGRDRGRWKFENGKICVAYTAAPTTWECNAWVVTGNVYSYANGSYTWTLN